MASLEQQIEQISRSFETLRLPHKLNQYRSLEKRLNSLRQQVNNSSPIQNELLAKLDYAKSRLDSSVICGVNQCFLCGNNAPITTNNQLTHSIPRYGRSVSAKVTNGKTESNTNYDKQNSWQSGSRSATSTPTPSDDTLLVPDYNSLPTGNDVSVNESKSQESKNEEKIVPVIEPPRSETVSEQSKPISVESPKKVEQSPSTKPVRPPIPTSPKALTAVKNGTNTGLNSTNGQRTVADSKNTNNGGVDKTMTTTNTSSSYRAYKDFINHYAANINKQSHNGSNSTP